MLCPGRGHPVPSDGMRRGINNCWSLLARELVFRLACRHRQGSKNNILLYCMPRSGSTWILNTVAAHPGMRYVGRPFMTAHRSRWRRVIPDMAQTARHTGDHDFWQYIHFEGEALQRFERFARNIVTARWHIYPTLHFRQPYFHRCTDRVIFQVHTIMPMIEWFDATFPVDTVILLRHPIPNALSVMAFGWRDECADFLNHQWFLDTHLTGEQVDFARQISRDGSELQRQVLDWSFRMLMPMRSFESGRHPNWLLLTYEQTVLEPDLMVRIMSQHLDLPDVDAMMRQVKLPSRNVSRATAGKVDDPEYLLGRWRSKVSEEEQRQAMAIPATFGLDVYRPDSIKPDPRLLHRPE